MAENIKTRKYYRMHNGTDWDRMHFVTDANSVDANDGDTMETKVGAIKGITTSTAVTEEGYAADATTVAALNSSLGGYALTTKDGKIAYYKVSEGADSATPFNSTKIKTSTVSASATTIKDGLKNTTITFPELTKIYGIASFPSTSDYDVSIRKITISGNTITVNVVNLHTSSNPSISGNWTAVGE